LTCPKASFFFLLLSGVFIHVSPFTCPNPFKPLLLPLSLPPLWCSFQLNHPYNIACIFFSCHRRPFVPPLPLGIWLDSQDVLFSHLSVFHAVQLCVCASTSDVRPPFELAPPFRTLFFFLRNLGSRSCSPLFLPLSSAVPANSAQLSPFLFPFPPRSSPPSCTGDTRFGRSFPSGVPLEVIPRVLLVHPPAPTPPNQELNL